MVLTKLLVGNQLMHYANVNYYVLLDCMSSMVLTKNICCCWSDAGVSHRLTLTVLIPVAFILINSI